MGSLDRKRRRLASVSIGCTTLPIGRGPLGCATDRPPCTFEGNEVAACAVHYNGTTSMRLHCTCIFATSCALCLTPRGQAGSRLAGPCRLLPTKGGGSVTGTREDGENAPKGETPM
ncbi:hypothetical protein V8C34DRAFT_291377 [Trichoderma compactum]